MSYYISIEQGRLTGFFAGVCAGVFGCGQACVLRRDPPSRLANRRGFFGGQSGEGVWDASISFGFLGVCSFAVFPSG